MMFLLSIVWTLKAGKDLNFDQLNYHLYGPHLLLQDRWQLDYFAGSLQTYLNGVSYVPFYWMVTQGWDDRLIAIILTSVHFLNILLVLALTKRVVGGPEGRRLALSVIASVLALIAPLYLIEIGTSFNDPLSSICVLTALLAYTRHRESRHTLVVLALAGVSLGVAVGIKLTNAVFFCGLLVVAIVDYSMGGREPRRTVIVRALVFGAGCVTGFLLLHGYWSWKLFIHFQSPIFPYYNNLFHAPDYPATPIQDKRYLGSGWLGLLTLPFEMARSEAWIYSETVSADIRFAAFLCLLAGAFAAHKIFKAGPQARHFWPPGYIHRRVTWQIFLFFVVSFFVWGGLFRIGRYALVLWLLLPVLIVAVLQARTLTRYAVVLGVLIIVTQGFINVENRLERWNGANWSGKWLDFDVPQDLSSPSNLGVFLTVDTQSFSSLALSLSSNAALVNLTGQYTLPNGDRMAPRLRALLEDDNRPRYLVRSVYRSRITRMSTEWKGAHWSSGIDSLLMPYGLKLEADKTCAQGALNFTPMSFFEHGGEGEGYDIYFCRLERISAQETANAIERQTRYDDLFDRMETLCPQNFYPPNATTVLADGEYVRSYFNTGTYMKTAKGELRAAAFRRMESVKLADLSTSSSSLPSKTSDCPPLIVSRYLR